MVVGGGFTDFQQQGGFDISRPPPRGHVEDPEADGDGEDSADRTESEEGGYEEAGESSTAEPDSQEQGGSVHPREIPSPDQAWMTIGDKAEEKGQEGASQLHEMRLRGQDLDRPLEFPRSGGAAAQETAVEETAQTAAEPVATHEDLEILEKGH